MSNPQIRMEHYANIVINILKIFIVKQQEELLVHGVYVYYAQQEYVV
jgi:hypothetical protein